MKEDIMAQIDFNNIKGYICDMDGVIYHGNKLLPGAAEFVNWLIEKEKKFVFLTPSEYIREKKG